MAGRYETLVRRLAEWHSASVSVVSDGGDPAWCLVSLVETPEQVAARRARSFYASPFYAMPDGDDEPHRVFSLGCGFGLETAFADFVAHYLDPGTRDIRYMPGRFDRRPLIEAATPEELEFRLEVMSGGGGGRAAP